MSPNFSHPNQGTILWDSGAGSFRLTLTGLSPSLAGLSRPLQLRQRGGSRAHNPTSPMDFSMEFGLDSSPFARCYSGNPSWFLFLPLLRCFRSGGSRSQKGSTVTRRATVRSLIQGSPVLRLHAPTRGFIAACRALLRRSSRAILQTAWHVGPFCDVCLAFGEPLIVYGLRYFGLCVVSCEL